MPYSPFRVAASLPVRGSDHANTPPLAFTANHPLQAGCYPPLLPVMPVRRGRRSEALSLLLLIVAAAAAAASAAAAEAVSSAPAVNAAAPPSSPACGIPRVPHLTLDAFTSRYKGRRPVIFTRSPLPPALLNLTTRRAFLDAFGPQPVILASANSFSHTKVHSTVAAYVVDHVATPQSPSALANESFYLFGDTPAAPVWAPLTSAYALPMDAAADEGLVAWGVGGLHSGVSFHTHGAAFAETLHGRKRWYLSAPAARPAFSGDASQLQWALVREARRRRLQRADDAMIHTPMAGVGLPIAGGGRYPDIRPDVTPEDAFAGPGPSIDPGHVVMDRGTAGASDGLAFISGGGDHDVDAGTSTFEGEPWHTGLLHTSALNYDCDDADADGDAYDDGVLTCTCGEGEVLYIPPQWWHATLNLDAWTFFISTFTQEATT